MRVSMRARMKVALIDNKLNNTLYYNYLSMIGAMRARTEVALIDNSLINR